MAAGFLMFGEQASLVELCGGILIISGLGINVFGNRAERPRLGAIG
jgi:hypothetical protein